MLGPGRRPLTGRAVLVCAGFTLFFACVVAPSASGFNFMQPKIKWPGNPAKITYFNKAQQKDHAVLEAVAAWNESGIDIRFKRVSKRKKAKLVIVNWNDVPCGNGLAMPKLVSKNGGKLKPKSAKVLLGAGGSETPNQCRYEDTLTAAHELGHVLGLDHEDGRCALMNSSIFVIQGFDDDPFGVAPQECPAAEPTTWYCRVLAPDDLEGAMRIYGGRPKVREPEYCEIPGADQDQALRDRRSTMLRGIERPE